MIVWRAVGGGLGGSVQLAERVLGEINGCDIRPFFDGDGGVIGRTKDDGEEYVNKVTTRIAMAPSFMMS